MRAKHFITEYKREITAKNLERKLLSAVANDMSNSIEGIQSFVKSHWPMTHEPRKDQVLDDLLKTLEEADPTKHKMYSEWIARVYAKGNYKVEDVLSTVADALYKYHELKIRKKLRPEHKDINQIGNKDFPGFISVVNQYHDIGLENQEVDKGDASEVYQDADVRIMIPNDQQAACYYGQGTQWCTSSTRGANYFDQYTRSGPLYILIPRKPEHKGEKYQFSASANMFMQENDQDVNLNWFFNIRFKGNKNLIDFFRKVQPEKMGNLIVLEDDDQVKLVMNFIKPYIIKYIKQAAENRPEFKDLSKAKVLERFADIAIKAINMSVADVKHLAGFKSRHSSIAEGAVGFDLSHLPELWAQKIHAQLDNRAPGTASSEKWLKLWPQVALVDKLKKLTVRKGNMKLKSGKWTPGSYFLYLGAKRIDQVDPYNLDKGKWVK